MKAVKHSRKFVWQRVKWFTGIERHKRDVIEEDQRRWQHSSSTVQDKRRVLPQVRDLLAIQRKQGHTKLVERDKAQSRRGPGGAVGFQVMAGSDSSWLPIIGACNLQSILVSVIVSVSFLSLLGIVERAIDKQGICFAYFVTHTRKKIFQLRSNVW